MNELLVRISAAVVCATAALAAVACNGPGASTQPSPAPSQRAGLAVGSVVTGAGAVLTPARDAARRPYSSSCDLADAGWVGRCLIVQGSAGTIATLTEQKSQTGSGPVDERDLVYVRQGGEWVLALSSSRQLQPGLGGGSPRAVPADLGDGVQRAVFMFTSGDPNFSDALDVVETDGRVVVHLALDKGKARSASGGGLEVWTRAAPDSADMYRHLVIRPAGGKWKVMVADVLPASTLPVDTAKQRQSF